MSGPAWKLDRRDSGRLFWRRDSQSDVSPATPLTASTPTKERVKFRYDVEVLEFWEQDDTAGVPTHDADVARRPMRAKHHGGQSLAACVVCLAAIAGTIWYQWAVGS